MDLLDVLTRLGLASFFVWALTRAWEVWRDWRRTQKNREAFLRALYAEIDFNTADMSRFLELAPSLKTFEKLFQDSAFVPHVTDARHTEIYRAGITNLHYLDNRLVGDAVRFYGDLEKVRTQIEGLSKPSFASISAQGRVGTMSTMYQTCQSCARLGARILKKMEMRYPEFGFERRRDLEDMRLGQTVKELSQRLEALESNLNRVRSK